MRIAAIKADGEFCQIESYANGPSSILDPAFVYIPSDLTDISKTFAREIARLRFVADDYADVERDHHLAFIGGFKR